LDILAAMLDGRLRLADVQLGLGLADVRELLLLWSREALLEAASIGVG